MVTRFRAGTVPFLVFPLALFLVSTAHADDTPATLKPKDVFELEYASDPQISPDGNRVVYVRNSMDIMKDRRRAKLWIIDRDGENHRPLTSSDGGEGSPRWSPDGTKLLYVAAGDGGAQLFVTWLASGQTARITQLTHSPSGLSWSPDGKHIAFSMLVPDPPESWIQMPKKPKGAEWAEPAKVIDELIYRVDGAGYVEHGHRHLFVVPAEGGSPRQITSGHFDHRGAPSWSADGKALFFSSNRRDDWQYDPRNSEVFTVSVVDGTITQLTDRQGPDNGPLVSPDGKLIAYTGFDDRYQGYQMNRFYLMNVDGSEKRSLKNTLDRAIGQYRWSADSSGLYFSYSTKGNTKVAFVTTDGEVTNLASDLGGTSLGRPYGGGSFSVSETGFIAYTHTRPEYPADVAIQKRGSSSPDAALITRLNEDLFDHKSLASVEEIEFESSHDGRKIQGWIMKPPGFEPAKKYPMVLEIHGGPFADYGDRFAAELQLYAAAGNVVFYMNPRGSTSYGEEFGNLIHHNYPGEDYDDLMSGVDAVIARGYVDPRQLFVTGGSGGGVLSAWIVGKTDRFRAAVVAKPVINWYSFVLTADMYNFFTKYWFPGFPWDHPEHYLKRSPLSLVGNVSTPTMLLTGEQDHRTPIAESEQFYQALKLRKIDTALVRIPGASHGIASRPSNLIAKVAYVLAWFDRHGEGGE